MNLALMFCALSSHLIITSDPTAANVELRCFVKHSQPEVQVIATRIIEKGHPLVIYVA